MGRYVNIGWIWIFGNKITLESSACWMCIVYPTHSLMCSQMKPRPWLRTYGRAIATGRSIRWLHFSKFLSRFSARLISYKNCNSSVVWGWENTDGSISFLTRCNNISFSFFIRYADGSAWKMTMLHLRFLSLCLLFHVTVASQNVEQGELNLFSMQVTYKVYSC